MIAFATGFKTSKKTPAAPKKSIPQAEPLTAPSSTMSELDYVYHPSFSLPATEERLFGPDAPAVAIPSWTDFFTFDEDAMPTRGRQTFLKTPDEKILFLRLNYARFCLARLIKSHKNSLAVWAQMALWRRRTTQARADLIQANMALVLAMAKRQRAINVEIEELIAEGNMALLRCVDRFDVSYGFKFSTYACRAILKSFFRLCSKANLHHQRFPVSYQPEFDRPASEAPRQETDWADSIAFVKKVLSENRACLNDMERTIITERFSLGERAKGKTLCEIGKIADLSIERVRQILNIAMGKIRTVLDEDLVTA